MKKLALLAVFAGLMAGCCGLFECKKNTDGTSTSCCACSHDHGVKDHHKKNEEVLSAGAELKSSVPVEGAEMLAE
ncbi:MAG: hypothetical protein QG632_893 [Candidatus Dependentiae bacterium]|nr:hypothetical protein [Candidatus Dependentiae bacterium]